MKTKKNTIGDARHYKDEIKDLVGKKLPICVGRGWMSCLSSLSLDG